MNNIIIRKGGNPPKDRKRFLEVDLPMAVKKLKRFVKLELITDKYGSTTLYKIKGTDIYVKFISTTSSRGDLGSSYKQSIMRKLPPGSRLMVVLTRTSVYPNNSFNSYKSNANKISKVRGILGVIDMLDIETYLPKLLKKQKVGNVVPWEQHRVGMELNKKNKETFTKDEVLKMFMEFSS